MTQVSSTCCGSSSLSQLQQLSAQRASQAGSGSDQLAQALSSLSNSGTDQSTGGVSLSASDLQSIFQQLGDATRSALLQAQSSDGTGAARGSGAPPPPPPGDGGEALADRVQGMDADGDGDISRAEFVSARPDGVSENQAGSLFDQIDTEGAGTLSTSALASGLEQLGPPPGGHQGPPPGPPPGQGGQDSSTSITGGTGTSDSSASSSTSDEAAAQNLMDRLLAQFEKAAQSYGVGSALGQSTSGNALAFSV